MLTLTSVTETQGTQSEKLSMKSHWDIWAYNTFCCLIMQNAEDLSHARLADCKSSRIPPTNAALPCTT